MTLKNFLSLRLCQAEAAAGENRPARLREVGLDRLMLGLEIWRICSGHPAGRRLGTFPCMRSDFLARQSTESFRYILEHFLSNHRDQKGW